MDKKSMGQPSCSCRLPKPGHWQLLMRAIGLSAVILW